MKEVLNDLFEYKSLNKQKAREILKNLAQGQYNNSEMASFLTVYIMRSITVEELQGFREAMLELCVPVDVSEYDPMDLCGTGGDGNDTFNVSTLASFIVAGAGQYVAKHGNVILVIAMHVGESQIQIMPARTIPYLRGASVLNGKAAS